MATASFTERSAWAIVALVRLGRIEDARNANSAFAQYIDELAIAPTDVDFFATSLPNMLLFHENQAGQREIVIARLRELHAPFCTIVDVELAHRVIE